MPPPPAGGPPCAIILRAALANQASRSLLLGCGDDGRGAGRDAGGGGDAAARTGAAGGAVSTSGVRTAKCSGSAPRVRSPAPAAAPRATSAEKLGATRLA